MSYGLNIEMHKQVSRGFESWAIVCKIVQPNLPRFERSENAT